MNNYLKYISISVTLLFTLALFQNCDEFHSLESYSIDYSPGDEPYNGDNGRGSRGDTDTAPKTPNTGTDPLAKTPHEDFFIGINYAWTTGGFGSDFGGSSDTKLGVAARIQTLDNDFAKMSQAGITVVRWWMFPKFFGYGVTIDKLGNISGTGGTLFQDIEAALDTAAKYNIKIMFCFFSFDNFFYYQDFPRLSPVLKDENKVNNMVENLIKPIVSRAYSYLFSKGYDDIIHSWDIINEPEWAIERLDPLNKDQTDFEPCKKQDYISQDGQAYNYCQGNQSTKDTDTVTLDEMENMIVKVSNAIKNINSNALVNVGFASAKWAPLWTNKLRSSVDFYQVHIYQWVHQFVYRYDLPISSYPGLEGKPVLMGEYPAVLNDDSTEIDHLTLIRKWYDLGYSGIMGWHFEDVSNILSDKNYGQDRFLNELKVLADEIQ